MEKLAASYENPLVTRSKQMLTEAFFELLKEKPGRKIRISNLCKKAGVARPTFYSHYNAIEDIPQTYFYKWLNDVYTWVNHKDQEKPASSFVPRRQHHFYELLFGYWCNEVEIVKRLQNAGYEKVILQCFIKAHELAMKNLIEPDFELSIELQDFLQSKGALVAYELYKYWITTDMQLSVAQLTEINSHLNTRQEIIEFRRISMDKSENKVA